MVSKIRFKNKEPFYRKAKYSDPYDDVWIKFGLVAFVVWLILYSI